MPKTPLQLCAAPVYFQSAPRGSLQMALFHDDHILEGFDDDDGIKSEMMMLAHGSILPVMLIVFSSRVKAGNAT